jgi:hypothetical protein
MSKGSLKWNMRFKIYFEFEIQILNLSGIPVTAVTGNPEPPRDFFSFGNQNLDNNTYMHLLL